MYYYKISSLWRSSIQSLINFNILNRPFMYVLCNFLGKFELYYKQNLSAQNLKLQILSIECLSSNLLIILSYSITCDLKNMKIKKILNEVMNHYSITSRNNASISNFAGGFRWKSEYLWCIIKFKFLRNLSKTRKFVTFEIQILKKFVKTINICKLFCSSLGLKI
ncbi:Uncharacterized protein FWK35_00014926 [Aphis craccivora]|uniref:Uncharacterized protein n=1 Tax=Aphis craccivora TaxID=307492 RepID=A0A6G0Y5Z4_APHCR|nr:Uncharacterized protein FWK35_00014926 [Aphis craccivora]